MTAIPGVRVTGTVVPTDTADVFPTHDEQYGLGGWRAVADVAARDAIPADRRREGMVVFVQSTGTPYQLLGGITNGDWQTLSLAGGGSSALDSAPVGTIMAWHKNGTGVPALSDDWVECNGQLLSDPESPLDGTTIPDLNGATGPAFAWMDADQGVFLRGATMSNMTPVADQFQGHEHNVPADVDAGVNTAFVTDTTDAVGTEPTIGAVDDGVNGTPRTGDETFPVHVKVVWIIRVKKSVVSPILVDSLIGQILAWHKDMPGMPPLPAEFVECNGQVLSDPLSPLDGETIPDLNGALAPPFAWVDAGQGVFIRGGTTSDATPVADQFQGHEHNVPEDIAGGSTTTAQKDGSDPQGAFGTSGIITKAPYGTPRFGDETFPVHVRMVYVMRVRAVNIAAAVMAEGKHLLAAGRLSVSTTEPIADGVSTTLYLQPYKGNKIGVWDTTGMAWGVVCFGPVGGLHEASIDNSGLSADTNYDVFVYDGGSGFAALELEAWSSDTARAVALVYRDGVLLKSTNESRRYYGTIRTNASVEFEDRGAPPESTNTYGRFVWNNYNRVWRLHRSWSQTTESWFATSGGSLGFELLGTNATNAAEYADVTTFRFVRGLAEDPVQGDLLLHGRFNDDGTDESSGAGVSLDGVTVAATVNASCNTQHANIVNGTYSSVTVPLTPRYEANPPIGYHYLSGLQAKTTTHGQGYVVSGQRYVGLQARMKG